MLLPPQVPFEVTTRSIRERGSVASSIVNHRSGFYNGPRAGSRSYAGATHTGVVGESRWLYKKCDPIVYFTRVDSENDRGAAITLRENAPGSGAYLEFVRRVIGKSRVERGVVVSRTAHGFALPDGFRAVPVTELG